MEAREKKIYKVTLIGTVVNAVLIALKFLAGVFGRSSAMIADAVHSLTDFVTDVIVLVFVHLSGKPRDKSHEYGHGKFETFATLLIGVLLVGAGIGLMVNGIKLVIASLNGEALPEPNWIALSVAIISIVVKEILYRYTAKVGKQVRSEAVVANAWHHRSDAISSLGTLVGIAGAMFFGVKWRILDPLAAVVVSLFIIKSGWDIIKPSTAELLEASLPDEEVKEISELIRSVPGVRDFHNLRTRKVGNEIAVDVHIKLDGGITLVEAHNIATKVEQAIRSRFGQGSMINVHMEPWKEGVKCADPSPVQTTDEFLKKKVRR
ncbi:MAG: cation diffusion facilitator family transporter [Muribaculaceae bacterium]|nr:cation diffusion facilitator family transporter [Muribaculaceae bacterium]